MKLCDIPEGTMVRLLEDTRVPPVHRPLLKGEVVKLLNIDGMFSCCVDATGQYVHPVAWAEVEAV